MNKLLFGFGLAAALCLTCLTGCDEDNRDTDVKATAPAPDFNSRQIMACPKCGAPTAPYRISTIKSYYHCSGQPPRYAYHETREWQHTIKVNDKDNTEH